VKEEAVMKILTNPSVHAALLLAILLTYAIFLCRDIGSIHGWITNDARYVESSYNVVYAQPSGIDLYGRGPGTSVLNAKKYIVFLLRGRNLQTDVDYWTSVADLMKSHNDVALIGYCDGQLCKSALHTMPQLPFQVYMSAEATSIQAVVNADDNGKAIVKSKSSLLQSEIAWRSSGRSPQTVVSEVTR
jgi:hypothetical protein